MPAPASPPPPGGFAYQSKVFQSGTVVTEQDANRWQQVERDGISYPYINNDNLDPIAQDGAILHDFYTNFRDILRVTDGSGLNVNYAAGAIRIGNAIATIPAATLTMANNATEFIFIDETGTVKKATGAPPAAFLMARVVTSGGQISTITDLRSRFFVPPSPPLVNGGRLTLASGNPTPTTNITAATVLYFTPFVGDRISIYQDGGWQERSFTERSLNLAGLAANTNYDIFIFDNAGTLTLQAVAWSNSGAGTSTRASAISQRNGIWVKTSDDRRYLGTIRTTATIGQCEDSEGFRYVWNVSNQQTRIARKLNGGNTWTYSTAAWRAANNDVANSVFFVTGFSQVVTAFNFASVVTSASAGDGYLGIGLNSSSSPIPDGFTANLGGGNNELLGQSTSASALVPDGYSFLCPLERAGAVMTFHGSNSVSFPIDNVGIQMEIVA